MLRTHVFPLNMMQPRTVVKYRLQLTAIQLSRSNLGTQPISRLSSLNAETIRSIGGSISVMVSVALATACQYI